MSNGNEEKLNEAIKGMMIIYLSLVFGLLLFLGLTVFMHYSNNTASLLNAELEYILSTTALLISIASIPLGYYIFSAKAKQATQLSGIDKKIDAYRNAIIIKFALFETAGLFNLIVFYLSQNKQSLMVFALVIIIFLINRPSISNYYDSVG